MVWQVLGAVILSILIVIQLCLSPFLVMLYDSPYAGNGPLVIVIPWFIVMATMVAGNIYLIYRIFK